MGIDVYIPWRPQPSRIPAFNFCVSWWIDNGFTVHLVDSGDEPFSLAASRNLAVTRATGPLVIADADTVGNAQAIREAVKLARNDNRTYLPYTEYRSLGGRGTEQALTGVPLDQCEHFHYPPAVSGLFVTTPETWFSYGGQDPRFKGWLGEDIAHKAAHETLVGELGRVEGHAYALGHDSAVKSGPQHDANAALMNRYIAASDSPPEMRALIGER